MANDLSELSVGDDGRVRLVIGAAGGTKITTAVAQSILKNQWLKTDVKEAIDMRRLHHQLMPMQVAYEEDTDEVSWFRFRFF